MARAATGSGTPGPGRGDTRARILSVALELFAERGYAGTSVRDIAEELGVTKAAVHYHFSAKEQIVPALVGPMLAHLEEVLARHEALPPDPRAVLLGVRDVLVASGPLLSVLADDPSVTTHSPEVHAQFEALAARTAEVLAGPGASPTRLLRGHCALGAFLAGWKTANAARSCAGVAAPELDAVLDAAIAALGEPADDAGS